MTSKGDLNVSWYHWKALNEYGAPMWFYVMFKPTLQELLLNIENNFVKIKTKLFRGNEAKLLILFKSP